MEVNDNMIKPQFYNFFNSNNTEEFDLKSLVL